MFWHFCVSKISLMWKIECGTPEARAVTMFKMAPKTGNSCRKKVPAHTTDEHNIDVSARVQCLKYGGSQNGVPLYASTWGLRESPT